MQLVICLMSSFCSSHLYDGISGSPWGQRSQSYSDILKREVTVALHVTADDDDDADDTITFVYKSSYVTKAHWRILE